jgi:predicted HicB family RNase H-like nuclease
VFIDACQKDRLQPFKSYSGKFVLRILPEDHAVMSRAAIASGKSLNKLAVEVLKQAASQ